MFVFQNNVSMVNWWLYLSISRTQWTCCKISLVVNQTTKLFWRAKDWTLTFDCGTYQLKGTTRVYVISHLFIDINVIVVEMYDHCMRKAALTFRFKVLKNKIFILNKKSLTQGTVWRKKYTWNCSFGMRFLERSRKITVDFLKQCNQISFPIKDIEVL